MKNLVVLLGILFTCFSESGIAQTTNEFGGSYGSDVKLPAQYEFDRVLKVRITSDVEPPFLMAWLLNESQGVFAMSEGDAENDGLSNGFTVIDEDKNLMVTYNIVAGVKSATKMKNMMTFGNSGEMDDEVMQYLKEKFKVEETGKTPTISGQVCTEYRVEDPIEDEYYIIAISNDDTFNWSRPFRQIDLMGYVPKLPYFSLLNAEIMMRVQTFSRSGNELIMQMEVLEWSENPDPIINSEWRILE